MNKENKKFYDISKNGVSEIAGAFLEERVDEDIKKRINISDLYPEKNIETDDWKYNDHSEKEKEATINIFGLGKKGYNLIVWISPEDGGKVYKEGRLNIEFPVFGNNEWALYGKHVPLLCNQTESIDLAMKLLKNGGVSMEPIVDLENVRRQPIGFKLEKIDDWIKECKKLMPEFIDIWNFIENGEDVENKIKMKKDVLLAMELADGNNYLFESIMARMGNEINPEGGHGGSWNSEGSGGMGMIVSVGANGEIVYGLGSTEGKTKCERCGCYYEGKKCPIC